MHAEYLRLCVSIFWPSSCSTVTAIRPPNTWHVNGALAIRLELRGRSLKTTKYIFLANVTNKYKFILLRRRNVGILAGTTVDGHLLSERARVGWMDKDGHLVQIMTYLPSSPDDLLRSIRCKYTTDFSTARCSCNTHNLECSPACGQC